MTRTNRTITILGAAALVAFTLSTPASANDEPSGSTVSISDLSSANVPLPRSRPASVRKRAASDWRAASRQIAWFFPPYRPFGTAHWPVLMLGIGY